MKTSKILSAAPLASFLIMPLLAAADPCIKHAFQSGLPDGADAGVVRPSNWNPCHVEAQAINTQTGTTYTYVDGDRAKLVTHSNASPITATLRNAAGAGFDNGWWLAVNNLGAGTLTITPTTSTIDGASSFVLATNQNAKINSDGTNYFGQGGAGNGGSSAFNAVTSDTNAAAATTVGSGASLTTSGTGTISGILQDKGGTAYNVKAPGYNVTGDGVTDDRGALNTLANTTLSGSGVLFFPAGTYLINSAMTFPAGVTLVFDRGAMLKAPTGVAVAINGIFRCDPGDQCLTWAGTGTFTFADDGPTKTFYAEWWGAKADNSTDNLNAFRKASIALPKNSTLQLQGGIYLSNAASNTTDTCTERTASDTSKCWGTFPIIRSGITLRGMGRGATWVKGTTGIQNDTHPIISPIVGVMGFYASWAPCVPTECVLHDITIEDFSIEDRNQLQATGYYGFFGSSEVLVYASYGITIRRMELLNNAGNSALQGFGACPGGGSCDGDGLTLENNWIHSDGRPNGVSVTTANGTFAPGNQYYIGFAASNFGNFARVTIKDNWVRGDFTVAAFDTNAHNTAALSRGFWITNNFIDGMDITTQFFSGQHMCLNPGYGEDIFISGNICTGLNGASGVRFGGEAPVGTVTGYTNVVVSENNFTDTGIAVYFATLDPVNNLRVLNNNFTATKLLAIAPTMANRIEIANNTLTRTSGDNDGIFVSTAACTEPTTLPATFLVSVHDNLTYSASGVPMVSKWENATCLEHRNMLFYNNLFQPFGATAIARAGSQHQVPLSTTVNNGATYRTTATYTGVIIGDEIRFLGIGDATSPNAFLPSNVIVSVQASAADKVEIVVVNKSSSSYVFDTTKRVWFVGERRGTGF